MRTTTLISRVIPYDYYVYENTKYVPIFPGKNCLHFFNGNTELILQMDDIQRYLFDKVIEGHNMVITGQGGTGKTFLVREIMRALEKKGVTYAATSTTGIGATNLGNASTIHKWAGLEDGRHLNSELLHLLQSDERFHQALSNIKGCECLIIDEVSMLSKKLFSQLEFLCRNIRNTNTYFGGLQLILAGDFYQLPPVRNEIYGDFGKYCFEVKWFNKIFPHRPCLVEVHRQADRTLISAVNELEKGEVSQTTANFMDSLSRPLDHKRTDDATHLFARNIDAQLFNYNKVMKHQGQLHIYESEDDGDSFYLSKFLAPKRLGLKLGCPVMLLANLSDILVNGKTGLITKLEDNSVYVSFNFGNFSKEVQLKQFVFTKYDPVTHRNIAKRVQFPITLSYAITIHKSQGMTIENVVVDCKNATIPGQIGVAVGRVKTTAGLCVKNFKTSLCSTHPSVVREFYENVGLGEFVENCTCCHPEIPSSTVSGDDADDDDDDRITICDVKDDKDLTSFDIPRKTDSDTESDIEVEGFEESDISELEIIQNVENIEKQMKLDRLNCILDPVVKTYSDTPVMDKVTKIVEKIKQNPDVFLDNYEKSKKDIEKQAMNIFVSEKVTFTAQHFREFYTTFQKFLTSRDYQTSLQKLGSVYNFKDDDQIIHRVFSKSMFTIQSEILHEVHNRKPKEMPSQQPRILTTKELESASRAKLRYISGYVIAKLNYRNSRTLRSTMFVPKKSEEFKCAQHKKELLENITITQSELKKSTEDPDSLSEVEWRQNLSSGAGLCNISDGAFKFFQRLELKTRAHLTEKNLAERKSEFYSIIEEDLLGDGDIKKSFIDVFREDIEEKHEFKLCERCITCKCIHGLFKSAIPLFLKVSVGQFRKDMLRNIKVEKGKALRKKVTEKHQKSEQLKFNISFIRNDTSINRSVSHLRLKSELMRDAKFLEGLCDKSSLLDLCAAYEVSVAKSKTKRDISILLQSKIVNSENMVHPEKLSISSTTVSQPGTSKSINEPLPGPSTCTLEEHTERDLSYSSSKKRKGPRKGGKGKSKGSKKAKYPCGVCSAECIEDVIACDSCDIWYHGVCVAIHDVDDMADETWFCPKCSKS